jgi:hypothetical protein
MDNDITIEGDGEGITLKNVDDIAVSVGTDPQEGLKCQVKEARCEIHAIGDCSVPGGIMEAVAAGVEVGRKL